jgi:superfamily I DNA and/or RNA helicase
MDESTLTQESVALIPISFGVQQMALIGDPQQLSPFVKHSGTAGKVSEDILKELSTSLFHRLKSSLPPKVQFFLNTQNRMHPALASFPSKEFYQGRLGNGVSEEDRKPPQFPWPDKSRPLCFLDVRGGEQRLGTSFTNPLQIAAVKEVIHCLCLNGMVAKQITVISFYNGLITGLKEALNGMPCEVSSVDGYQGKENEVIIYCTVRSNMHGSLDFIEDRQRVNVLLTRAKVALIGVGDRLCMESSVLWERWLAQAPVLDRSDLSRKAINKSKPPFKAKSSDHKKK